MCREKPGPQSAQSSLLQGIFFLAARQAPRCAQGKKPRLASRRISIYSRLHSPPQLLCSTYARRILISAKGSAASGADLIPSVKSWAVTATKTQLPPLLANTSVSRTFHTLDISAPAMSQYYEPPQWPPAGQTGWDHQTPPPARSGMLSSAVFFRGFGLTMYSNGRC